MAKRFAVLVGVMALMLTAALTAALAQTQEQYGGEEVSATGVLMAGLPADAGGFGTHSITDEATGTLYALRGAGVDLASYEGQRVTVYGALTPGEEGSGQGEFGGNGKASRRPDRTSVAATPPSTPASALSFGFTASPDHE